MKHLDAVRSAAGGPTWRALDLRPGARRTRTKVAATVLAGLALVAGGVRASDQASAAAVQPGAAAAAEKAVSVRASADSYVVKSQPGSNFGSRTSAFATTAENRTLVRFDTAAAVPKGKRVVRAALRLYVLRVDVSGPGVRVLRTPTSWTEGGVTAKNRPASGAFVSAATPVRASRAWLSVPVDASSVTVGGATSYELLHTVVGSDLQIATRESGQAPTLELQVADAAAAPAPAPKATGVLPFTMPSAGALKTGKKLVFAHYFTPFPLSLDNKPAAVDYYTKAFLNPSGEKGKHSAYGGLMRDRPIGRSPLSGDWVGTDYATEIKQARSAGLDGFSVDLLNLRNFHYDRVVKLLEVAHRVDPDFKIMLMPDMTLLHDESSSYLASRVAALGKYPAAFHLPDGRLVVSPFKTEQHNAAWWKTWLGTMKSAQKTNVAFVPTILDWQAHRNQFASISYGFSHWGLRNPKSNHNNPKHAVLAHSMGKVWMGPAHAQDVRPIQGLYEEAGNTETLRLSWQGVVNSDTDWVNIPTWNDYSEGTGLAPSAHHGYAFLDISAYYIAQWKTGKAPSIVRDGLYLSHRSQPYAAKPTFKQSKLMKLRAGTTPARDTVEALVFLTSPATVTVKVGGKTYTWQAPAGVNAKTFPLGTGTVSGSVSRGGTTTTKVTSPFTVTSKPLVQDLQYDAVSSLRP